MDVGSIITRVTPSDLTMLGGALKTLGLPIPTHVKDIYKVRRGRLTYVKIWSIIDLGTCRTTDLFVTDSEYRTIDISFLPILGKDVLNFTNIVDIDKVLEGK